MLQCRNAPHFRQTSAMHVDFLLCERQTLLPRLAIELDDGSHANARRMAADRRKAELLREAGTPLLRQRSCAAYDVRDLQEQIERALRAPDDPRAGIVVQPRRAIE